MRDDAGLPSQPSVGAAGCLLLARSVLPSDTSVVQQPNKNASSPRVTSMRVMPVAGNDSMLLNLSGAHAPFFTRNVVILTDDAGHTGAGEVPGGASISQVLEQATSEIVGQPITAYNEVLQSIRQRFG